MKILRTINDVVSFVQSHHSENRTVGLVPTMGSLHAGHLSLVKKSVKDNDITVVSIFVNPTQFNNKEDLRCYPRNEEEDFKLLASEKVDAVFAPSEKEIYPDGAVLPETGYDFGILSEVMEGKHRPGHFQGVAHIVKLLFETVEPTRAYFGEKDFQQIAIIREMVKQEGLKVEIIACPIARADDGLALSSRNALLSEEEREVASEIYSTLKYSVDYSKDHSVRATHDTVVERIDAVPNLKVEYFEIFDARTFEPVEEWDESPWIVGCITVYCGETRLIDNIVYRQPNN